MGLEAAALMAGGTLLGGVLQSNAAKKAAETSANAQIQTAQTAANAAQFRPVGVTSNFGTSNFQFNPEGYLTGAGYTLAPQLQGVQNTLLGGVPQSLQDAANIQAMGRQYMAQSPQEAAQQYITNQQALLAPSREKESANLLNQLSNSGRTGLSIAQGGGMGASNPEFQALANARALQDLQLAAQAQQAGQQQYTFGQGLLSGAYSPLQTQLGTSQLVEQLGQSPLDIGAQLGGRTATAGANVGQSLLIGGLSAARTAQAGNAVSPFGTALGGLTSNPAFANALTGQGQGNSGYTYNSPYGTNYGVSADYGVSQPSVWSSPDYSSGANYGYSSGGSYGLQSSGGTGLQGTWQ